MDKQLLHWLSGLVLMVVVASASAKESPATKSQVPVRWLEPVSTLEELSGTALQESNIVSDFAMMVARDFLIGKQLAIEVGGKGGPGYMAETSTIRLPYRYLSDVVRAQSDIVEDRTVALAQGMDMIEYTLYHLFGHILAADLSPDTDDEAEDISTWIMLTRWPNGGEQWLTSIRAFAKASQTLDGPLSDYWHAHSLYKSRQRELECVILGSDPERYEPLMPAVLEPDKRRSQCVTAWSELDQRMGKRLQELMMQP